jgi:hypothetical protein
MLSAAKITSVTSTTTTPSRAWPPLAGVSTRKCWPSSLAADGQHAQQLHGAVVAACLRRPVLRDLDAGEDQQHAEDDSSHQNCSMSAAPAR